MSKGGRIRDQTARERIAAQQAAARKAEVRRRATIAGGSILAVLVIVIGIVIYYNVKSPAKSAPVSGGVHGTVLPASVSNEITGVPAATLDQIGSGSVPSFKNTMYSGSPVIPVTDTPLVSGGKPEMLYIGAEFCPFCGAMRWSMAVALSRFGTFTTPLRGFHSSSVDTDPSTPTLTFYKAGYTSKYLTFTPVENEDVNRNLLQKTTAAQQALWQKYDSSSEGVGYPFISFGNKSIIKAPLYDPGVLKGLTWAQVAADLHNASSPVAQAADGAANYMTAAICKMTNNLPAAVCTSSAVSSLESGI